MNVLIKMNVILHLRDLAEVVILSVYSGWVVSASEAIYSPLCTMETPSIDYVPAYN